MCLDLNVYPEDEAVFVTARNTWLSKITGDVASFPTGGLSAVYACNAYPPTIDDIYLCGRYIEIDGPGGVLGSAGPIYVRSSGANAGLPISGRMQFDNPDIQRLKDQGRFEAVIVHEMGHILGVGTLWVRNNIAGTDAENCT